jgi:hypothetical protein
MRTIVSLLSTTFEDWVRPAHLLWFAAEAEAEGRAWFRVSHRGRAPGRVIAEAAQNGAQQPRANGPWQLLVVLDAAQFEPSALEGWLPAIVGAAQPPQRVALLLVAGEPTAAHATLHHVHERYGQFRWLVLSAPTFGRDDATELKVLAANTLLLLARHPAALPEGVIATLLLHDPTLAGRNGCAVDRDALEVATHGMWATLEAAELDVSVEPPTYVYPLVTPLVGDLGRGPDVPSPRPLLRHLPWVTVGDAEAQANELDRSWRERVVAGAHDAKLASQAATLEAQRETLDALRRDASAQPPADAARSARDPLRATPLDRAGLHRWEQKLAASLDPNRVTTASPDVALPAAQAWEVALERFRQAAASRPSWTSVALVNGLIVVGILAAMSGFADGWLRLAVVAVGVVLINFVSLVAIVWRFARAARSLERLRREANRVLLSSWLAERERLQRRYEHFVNVVNLRHARAGLGRAAVAALAVEESRAWIREALLPDLERLRRAFGVRAALRPSPPRPLELADALPYALQPFAHLHSYRDPHTRHEVLVRINPRGNGGQPRALPPDPLLWSLEHFEIAILERGSQSS